MADEKYAERYHLASLANRLTGGDEIYEMFSNHLLKFEWVLMRSNNAFIITDNAGFALDENDIV